MTRPDDIADLPEHEQRGPVLFVISDPSLMITYPEVGQHLLSAVTAAKEAGLRAAADGQVYKRLDLEQAKQRLVNAQERWDRNDADYQAAAADPTLFTDGWKRNNLDYWAMGEGLPKIEWVTP